MPPLHVAFLRGINLGGRRLKMDRLRGHLEAFGLPDVSTFLASGNAIFAHSGSDLPELERRLEDHLDEVLGFAVDTFVRPMADLRQLSALEAVAAAEEDGFTPHVIFLRRKGGEEVGDRLASLEAPGDRFRVLGRDLLWFRRGRLKESSISSRDLEKALGGSDHTMRNMNTVRRIVRKFGG